MTRGRKGQEKFSLELSYVGLELSGPILCYSFVDIKMHTVIWNSFLNNRKSTVYSRLCPLRPPCSYRGHYWISLMKTPCQISLLWGPHLVHGKYSAILLPTFWACWPTSQQQNSELYRQSITLCISFLLSQICDFTLLEVTCPKSVSQG